MRDLLLGRTVPLVLARRERRRQQPPHTDARRQANHQAHHRQHEAVAQDHAQHRHLVRANRHPDPDLPRGGRRQPKAS
jgi:hypothetical protein